MKIAIFENEYASVNGAFETANLLYFNDSLDITVYPSSQSANLSRINQFRVIFIDIDLSSKSDLDGFSLIDNLYTADNTIIEKIVILTGNNKIKEALINRSIDPELIKIIIKPTNYEEINESIKAVTASA